MEDPKIQDHLSSEYPEFLDHLPLYFETTEEELYVKNLINTFNINYQYEKFESAFFNLHILYMITIYSHILKIKNNNPEEFYISLIGLDKNEVKNYREKFKDKKITLFDFSMFKENNVFCFFESLGFLERELEQMSESVDKRNIYAHPRGRIIIDASQKLDELVQKDIIALKMLHEKIVPKVANIFILFLEEKFKDFKEELDELIKLNESHTGADDEGKKIIKSDIKRINDVIEEKFKDFLVQENYLNKLDISDCSNTNIEKYSGVREFEEKKKLYLKFKEIFE